MFEYLNAWAAAATIAGALFAAIKWILVEPLAKEVHEIKESQNLQVARIDHLYHISVELLRERRK